MDRVEKFISGELSDGATFGNLDVEVLISATQAKIKKRANRRKLMYSTPVLVLLIFGFFTLFQERGGITPFHEGELFMAGWEYTWTENEESLIEDPRGDELYESSVDYLFDQPYYSYIDDANVLLDENDLEALLVYLKEA